MKCPYGGDCIDPGYPSDCLVNDCCFIFSTEVEKTEFDNLPEKYEVEREGQIVKFKNRNQLKFFLLDVQNSKEYKIFFIDIEGKRTQAKL